MDEPKNANIFGGGKRPFFARDVDRDERSRDHEVETLVGQNVAVEGELVGTGTMAIMGKITGVVRTNGHVEIGKDAHVKAGVEAESVRIAGEVKGSVKAIGKVELLASARLVGDVEAERLVIADGAFFQGKSTMGAADIREKDKKIRADPRAEKSSKHLGHDVVPRTA